MVGSTAEELSKLELNGDSIASVPNLHKNLSILSPDQVCDFFLKFWLVFSFLFFFNDYFNLDGGGRLSLRRCWWRPGRVICLKTGRSPALRMKKREVSSSRSSISSSFFFLFLSIIFFIS